MMLSTAAQKNEANENALLKMQESFEPAEVNLRPWQRTYMQMIEAQTKREILFVVDPEGNHDKTWLAKYIRANQDSMYLTTTNTNNIFIAYPNQSVVMFDLTRQLQEVINYGTLESLKRNCLFPEV